MPEYKSDTSFSLHCEDELEFIGLEVGGSAESDGAAVDFLPPINAVFYCFYITAQLNNDKDGWECGWCGIFLYQSMQQELSNMC